MSSTILHANEKLNVNNYHQWKFRVNLILMKEGLWKHVDRKRKAPISNKEGSSSLEKWEAEGENAFATICLAINDTEMSHVHDCTTTTEVWKKLANVYESKGVAHELYLHRQLSNFKKLDDDMMQQHINRLTKIIAQLAGVSEMITDRSIAITLLDSLPKSYDMLKVSL